MTDLVTITFLEDLELTLLQLKSIDKYVLGDYTINIVLNEPNSNDRKKLQKKIAKKLSNLKIKANIYTFENIVCSQESVEHLDGFDWLGFTSGWRRQQLIKLLFPSRENYIVLDAKDIFLAPIFVNQIECWNYEPNIEKIEPEWNEFIRAAKIKLLNDDNVIINFKRNTTPRLVNPVIVEKILNRFKNREEFILWFLGFRLPAEFFLLDFFESYRNPPSNNYIQIRSIDDLIAANKLHNKANILKFHRSIFNLNQIENTKLIERLQK